jgi:hypothetical protein
MKFTKSDQKKLARLASKHRKSFAAGKPLTVKEALEYQALSKKALSVFEEELIKMYGKSK